MCFSTLGHEALQVREIVGRRRLRSWSRAGRVRPVQGIAPASWPGDFQEQAGRIRIGQCGTVERNRPMAEYERPPGTVIVMAARGDGRHHLRDRRRRSAFARSRGAATSRNRRTQQRAGWWIDTHTRPSPRRDFDDARLHSFPKSSKRVSTKPRLRASTTSAPCCGYSDPCRAGVATASRGAGTAFAKLLSGSLRARRARTTSPRRSVAVGHERARRWIDRTVTAETYATSSPFELRVELRTAEHRQDAVDVHDETVLEHSRRAASSGTSSMSIEPPACSTRPRRARTRAAHGRRRRARAWTPRARGSAANPPRPRSHLMYGETARVDAMRLRRVV